MLVSVIANNEEYLSFDCINNKIKNERVEFPLYCLGIGLFISFLIYKKVATDSTTKHTRNSQRTLRSRLPNIILAK